MPIPDLVALGAAQTGLQYRLTSPTGDELPFNVGNVDSNGVEAYVSLLDGWDSPDVRADILDRPRDHGQYLGDFFYSGRLLTLTGWLYSPNGIEPLRLARERLVTAVDNLDTYSVLHVAETIPKQVRCRRVGKVGLKQTGKHLLEFDIALLAPDPRRYSETVTTLQISDGGSADAVVGGSFRAGTPVLVTLTPNAPVASPPPIVLTESTTGASISVTGAKRTQFGNAIGFSDTTPVVLDATAQTVISGGVLAFRRVLSALVFLSLPPATPVHFTVTGGSATVQYRDAWS